MNRTERREIIQSAASRQILASRRRAVVIVSVAVMAILIIVAVVLASRVPKAASDAPISATLAVGQKAPLFAVATTNGPFDLAASAGKPTLLEVFASWCPHCQREVPVLDRLYAKYKGRVNLVSVAGSPYGIDQTQPESQADVIAFMTQFKATYPIAFDPNLDVARKYLEGGFPTLVLIGADGNVAAIRDGEVPEGDLTKALDAVAGGKKPDPKMGSKR
jgi:cytochrome c biogenesis protein CcmG/thiol:disulfide interchange protein DsbE